MKDSIQKTTQDLLKNMSFDGVLCSVSEEIEGEYKVHIEANPEDSGVLIGHHGEGVDALQLILNLTINKNNEDWKRITVNINDYREQREEAVKNVVLNAAQSVKTTNKPVILNYLPSHERRIAHMILSEDNQIETYSQGYGKYRRLVIAPKNQ